MVFILHELAKSRHDALEGFAKSTMELPITPLSDTEHHVMLAISNSVQDPGRLKCPPARHSR